MTHTVIEGPHPLGPEYAVHRACRRLSHADRVRLWAVYDCYTFAPADQRQWAAAKLGVTL